MIHRPCWTFIYWTTLMKLPNMQLYPLFNNGQLSNHVYVILGTVSVFFVIQKLLLQLFIYLIKRFLCHSPFTSALVVSYCDRKCETLPLMDWSKPTACMSLDLLSQVIYLLLDVMYSFPNKEGASVESFPTAFAIPIGLVKLVQGLWLLDHNDHQVHTYLTDLIFPSICIQICCSRKNKIFIVFKRKCNLSICIVTIFTA